MPIPEEMPIIAAAVLSHEGIVRWWLVLPVCLLGVLSGDMVLYWVGRHWGEQVLNWRLVRLVLSSAREQWLKAAYRRHALKTVVTARHIMGLRAAAFLTAGSASVPFWKFVVADAGAALFGVPLVFGLAYFFTDQIKVIMADVHRGRTLARSRWPPGAGGDAGRRRVAMASSRREGASGRGTGRGTFAAAMSARGWRPITGAKDERIVAPFFRRREGDRCRSGSGSSSKRVGIRHVERVPRMGTSSRWGDSRLPEGRIDPECGEGSVCRREHFREQNPERIEGSGCR